MVLVELDEKNITSYRQNLTKLPKIYIASIITANAKVFLSEFKNNSDYKLYYTNTNSRFWNQPHPEQLVEDKKIGKFKLVKLLRKFVTLAPTKCGGIELDGSEFTKVKGLKPK